MKSIFKKNVMTTYILIKAILVSTLDFKKIVLLQKIILLQLCFIISFAGNLAVAQNQQHMKMVNMNIHCFDGDWQFRFRHILNKFIELSPELIALQEVCENPQNRESQIEFIRNYLSQNGYPIQNLAAQYTHKAWDKYDEYIVLISKTKVSYVDQGFLPQSILQRGYIGFKINQNWYINTHLEYRADHAHFRKTQIEFLMQRFANEPHLIGGDFNSSINSFEQSGLGSSGYLAVFPGESHLGGDGNDSNSIDGFWLSPQLRNNIEYINGEVILNQKVDDQFLSDHSGIFLKFGFKSY